MFCFAQCCRLCLTNNKTLTDYKINDMNDISYYKKLLDIMPRLILESYEQFPTKICSKCQNQVDITYKFIKSCTKSHELLHEYYLQMKSVNTNSVNNKYSLNLLVSDETVTTKKCNDISLKIKQFAKIPAYEIVSIKQEYNLEQTSDNNDVLKESGTSNETIFQAVTQKEVPPHLIIQRDHPIERNLDANKCNICGVHFINEDILKVHYERYHFQLNQNENHLEPETESVTTLQNKTPDVNYYDVNLYKDRQSRLYKWCVVCSLVFTNRMALRRHVRRSHQQPYPCTLCTITFDQWLNLERHHRAVHMQERPFPCDLCGKTYKTLRCLQYHRETSHFKKREHQCNVCKKSFTKSYKLKFHIRRFHLEINQQHINEPRNDCKFIIPDQQPPLHETTKYNDLKLNDIIGKDGNVNKAVPSSSKAFTNIIETETLDIKEVFNMDPIAHGISDEKNLNFNRDNDDDDEEAYIIGNQNDNLTIQINSPTQSDWNLFGLENDEEAIKTSTDEVKLLINSKMTKCPVCQKEFASVHGVRKHYRTVHKQERRHKCDKCNKSYTTSTSLKCHVEVAHLGIKKFQCHICLKQFVKIRTLRLHLIIVHSLKHSNDRQCSTCGKIFLSSKTLQKHISSKHGVTLIAGINTNSNSESLELEDTTIIPTIEIADSEDDYAADESTITTNFMNKNEPIISSNKCPLCEKEFANPSNVRKHYRTIHKQERRYMCDICNKTFTGMASLKYHNDVTHLGIKNFQCHICLKMFGLYKSLRLHLNNVHSFKTPDEKECDICGKTFVNMKKFEIHLKNKHGIASTSETSETPQLDQQFEASQKNLDDLIEKIEESNNEPKCPICHKMYATFRKLRLHLRGVHSINNGNNVQCYICKRYFFSTKYLLAHTKLRHTDIMVQQSDDTTSTEPVLDSNSIKEEHQDQPVVVSDLNENSNPLIQIEEIVIKQEHIF